ncbi:anti-virulence regulator CigR family protein [Atopomonas sediminilitoris]|uniref:anti-virulence regulator CigR family protein n=1 Tax=Atopomonas sediminilitoris TaxID=2919919 RepID=UPI001F4EF192|nr:anti-virulence regulator CigR family protein [Atopomonas sediminilitoris]MCJ8170045.1 anti-virulence regulator CigR family protein [Atopomonas sediminilitoris]
MKRTVIAALSLCLSLGAYAGNHKDKEKGKDKHTEYTEQTSSTQLPSINHEQIRDILLGQREAIGPTKALPPGMQKRLSKGKPLPPGIAKRFSPDVLSKLPRYPGYDWEMAGTDVVLVETASRVISDVLYGVLQ